MAYVVAARWRARQSKEERLAELIRELTPVSRSEPAVRFFQAQRSLEDPCMFLLYEQYADEAGYRAHMETEHFARLVLGEAISELLEKRVREFYATIDDAAGGI